MVTWQDQSQSYNSSLSAESWNRQWIAIIFLTVDGVSQQPNERVRMWMGSSPLLAANPVWVVEIMQFGKWMVILLFASRSGFANTANQENPDVGIESDTLRFPTVASDAMTGSALWFCALFPRLCCSTSKNKYGTSAWRWQLYKSPGESRGL